MGRVTRNTAALLCGAALSTVLAAAAEAQQTTPTQPRVTLLQRLVVGAGAAEKVAIDTPQSVTVVNQEDIDRQQASTVGELLRDIPGVNTSGSDRLFGQTFNIRGIGAPEAANEEGRIIVTVDGATKFYEQYRMGGLFTDPELYKQVEVLRGPASSTLYGSGAIGGVINFTTKDASDFIAEGQTGALRLKGGFNSNRDGWLGSMILAQRMGDNAEFLLAGNYRRADSYLTGSGAVVRSSDFAAWSGLAKGTFKVGDEGTLRLSYQHWDSNADNQDYAQVGTQTAFGTVDRHVIDKTAVVAYENPFSDNDLIDLKIAASFSDTTVDQTNASSSCAGNSLFCDSRYGYQTWQLNVQNTSEWRGDKWENFLTYGWQTAYQVRSAAATSLTGTPVAFGHHPEGTDFKTGFFIQDEFIWDERLTIVPGARIDWRQLTPNASTTLASSTQDVAISPKIAAHYKINDTLAFFGSVAHTERFATLDEMFSTPFPSLNLNKERSNNYELGFALSTYDMFQSGDALQLKTTGFYNDITDLIVRQCSNAANCTAGGFTQQYVNIGRAHIYGFEVEAAYDSDYVFATAGYSHVIGRDASTGALLTTVAPHELALTLGGKLPEHDLKFGWKARFVAAPQDPARRSATPIGTSTRFAQAFNVHDVFLTWTPQEGALKGWDAQLGVDNIFNADYKEFLNNDSAKGRTYKISLSKQFGWN